AVEELLQAGAVLGGEVARVARQRLLVPAAVAVALVEALEQGGVVVVQAARHHAGAVAQRAGRAHLGGDRLADEGSLVGQLVKDLGEVGLHLEGDPRGLWGLARHDFALCRFAALSSVSVPPVCSGRKRASPVSRGIRRRGHWRKCENARYRGRVSG